jgi:hypothetical protein
VEKAHDSMSFPVGGEKNFFFFPFTELMNENYFSSPQSTASQADERTQTLIQHTRFWVATKFYLKSFVFGEMQNVVQYRFEPSST